MDDKTRQETLDRYFKLKNEFKKWEKEQKENEENDGGGFQF